MPSTEQTVAERTVAERRPAYLTELARGTDHFHERRRPDCPWCGSTALAVRLRTPDLLQHKPGAFVIERCRDCGHCFQNPLLTPEGLEFYERDAAARTARVFAARHGVRRHRSAARALLPFGEPESWLDVGTGDALFPAVAQQIHPYTSFDGLDAGPAVEKAAERGRIEEAHRGPLPTLAPRLTDRYDVLSMFHHLERVLDPRAELVAAHTVLRPGGHLLIETPDPDSRAAALLGRWWPSHCRTLHLIPPANLTRELRHLGFTIILTDHRAAHAPLDLSGALTLALDHYLPRPDTPWRTHPPTSAQRRARTFLTRATIPLTTAAQATDHALTPLTSRTTFTNAYRVIARKDTRA
ncbi:class I SAM-dependent methyltransferase [Streptomyces sp. NPDC091292]|uniref:class I SAM-dependent methyltransferase n=1 Tax=Streptomyces sp. NPDC091292 TaxID=3365991 RepID=UPI00381354CF